MESEKDHEINRAEKTSLLKSIPLAFHSRAFYREVARDWKGRGFLLLVLVLAVLWIPTMVHFHVSAMADFQKELNEIADQIPPIRIKNGHVTVDAELPYVITDPKGKEVAILDTTGNYTSLEGKEARLLLTENRLHFRNNQQQIRIHDLSKVEHFELTSDRAKSWIATFRQWLAFILYPIALAFSVVWRIVQALVYALIGVILANSLKMPLKYGSLLQLSLVAMIPALVFKTVFQASGLRFPLMSLVGVALVIGYLAFGIKAASE